MRVALLLALLAVAGCDAFGGTPDPAWTEAGAVAVFDYTPGPDSIYTWGVAAEGTYAAVPATPRALEMRIVASPDWRRTDRYVDWRDTAAPDFTLSQFQSVFELPLDDADVEVADDGLAVVVDVDCSGGGWVSGGSSGRLAFIRVPNRAGTVQDINNCGHSGALTGPTFPATGPESVTVPAGTFSAIRIETPVVGYPGGTAVEWWSWDAGLVRLDVVGPEGGLRGRFERSAGE
ncbi:hypothetical protein [Rubrivirga sp. IMCC45206]|uniref:hypothetical protein n=1 Tax=Rubrivirga sp. IMCC45206 TaxID=3391614 RepID=UPI00398FFBFD